MKSNTLRKIFLLFTVLCFTNTVFAKSKLYPITEDWKYSKGDNKVWSSPDFTGDSTWETTKIPAKLKGDENGFFWIRSTLSIPSELSGQEVFLEFGSSIASTEIFVDGVLVGRHGTIEPQAHVSHVDNTVVTISDSSIKNGKIQIAIRAKSNASTTIFSTFSFVNKDRFISTKIFQPLLNTTVYYMMAAICFFLGCYFILQIAADHSDKASLFFSLTLIFASIYFLDMASDFVLLPFPWQLGLSRFCLLLSIGFLTLFLCTYFKLKTKILKIIIYAIFGLFAILYIISTRDSVFQENLFTISLLPIFICIFYIYGILAKAIKLHQNDAKIMVVGISVAMLFGVHDIIYQASGHIPFAWLQGFAFFFIDVTMFIVVSLQAIQNKRSVNEFMATTSTQKEKLDEIISKAAELSKETYEIAESLNQSVSNVANSVMDSADKANEIGRAISKQNDSITNTSQAVTNLVSSVRNVKNEVQNETAVVDTTISETGNLINGVNEVAEVIKNAADFSVSLGSLTQKSSMEIGQLVNVMQSIKDASAEILEIVKVVSNFSNKTNMLSMNASIEAAHSGNAGKGFSVIAHQIKSLAEASNTQADKINDIAKQITSQIENSFDLSKNIQIALQNIANEAVQTSDQISESARSMEIQREAGRRISEATSVMSESAGKVKSESDQQYSFSEQVSANMEELSLASSSAASAVGEIITQTQLLSSQASSLKELAQRAQDAAAGLNQLIQI